MSSTMEPVPVLVGQSGSLNGYRWSINDELIIGRSDDCDITIPDQQVSRQHACLVNEGGAIYLEDLKRKNGTYRNGKTVLEKVRLSDGDSLQVALAQEFIFLSKDATVPLGTSDFEDSPLSLRPELRINREAHKVWVGEIEVRPPLSALQFKLLDFLNENKGIVLSRQEIIEHVWGPEASVGVTDQALDALIRRLRDRLSTTFPGHDFIITVRGQGFRLDTG
mgnify:CR=1 FL=1